MRRVVIIPAPTDRATPDLTGIAIGAAMVPAAFGVFPCLFWLARINGWC